MSQKFFPSFILVVFVFISNFALAAHGFAWSDKANFTGTRDLVGQYNYNSSGSSIKVTYQSTGSYLIRFEGLGSYRLNGGHVQVTSYGSNKTYCKVEGWNRFRKMNVAVSCYNTLGSKVDSQFTVSVRNPEESFVSYAYTYADEATESEYIAENKYTKTPGSDVLIRRNSIGDYVALFRGLSSYLTKGGHAQVTAVGTNNYSCQVKSWYKVGDDLQVNVKCFSSEGQVVDSRFLLHFTAQNLHNEDNMSAAYVWGSKPSTSDYSAHSHYSSPVAEIKRLGLGKYKVSFNPIVGFGKSNVQVSTYGSDFAHCKVHYWSDYGSKLSANVSCFKQDGSFADRKFVLRLIHK